MLQRGEIKIRNGMYFNTGHTFCVLDTKEREPSFGVIFT